MPTLGWILETAEDRFYERCGGYELAFEPPKIDCPICGATFAEPLAVSWHVNEAHSLERPIMLLAGAPIPSRAVYSVPVDPNTVSFANTTGIRATCNGRVLAGAVENDVVARLAEERRAIFQIELENRRAEDAAKVSASYTVITSVPDEADLEAVDRLFLQHLAVESPTQSDVRTFADAAGRYASADRYTDGLAQYVYAILAKEGDRTAGTTLPFDAFHLKIQQALAELVDHQTRPIPRAVCAAARLNINDVRRLYPGGGNPTLDGALELFHGLAQDDAAPTIGANGGEPALQPICPIDRDTHLVLRAYDDLFRGRARSSSELVDEYAARAEDGTLSAFDRTKLRVMLALHLLVSGHPPDAVPHLNELVLDPLFGRWATRSLETMEIA